MGFAFISLCKVLPALSLCLVLSSLTVECNHHHHHIPPIPSPLPSPGHFPPISSPHPSPGHFPPISSPLPNPHFPPIGSPLPDPKSLPPRRLVAVEGVVFCKSCKFPKVDTLMGAKPLSDAVVRLVCNNTRKPTRVEGHTDKNGYFFLQAPKRVTSYAYHRCRVFLVSSATCKTATNLNRGIKGATLMSMRPPVPDLKFNLYTVGPFAFAPTTCPK